MIRRLALFLLPTLAGALPACVTDEGVDAFPLYRSRGDDAKGSVSVLWPLSHFEWSEGSSRSWVFPFYFRDVQGDEREVFGAPIVPLFVRERARDRRSVRLFPIFSRTEDRSGRETSLLLFLAKWRTHASGRLDRLALFPLFDWSRKGGGSRLVLGGGLDAFPTGPLLALFEWDGGGVSIGPEGDRPARSVSVGSVWGRLFELFHFDDRGRYDDVRLATVLASEDLSLVRFRTPHTDVGEDDRHRRIVFPVFFDVARDEGRHTVVVWPPYGRTRRDGHTIERFVFFPLLRTFDDPQEGRSGFDVLWPLAGRRVEGEVRRLWLHPVFAWAAGPRGYEWRLLLGLLGYGRSGDRRLIRVLFVPFEF